MIIFPAFWGSGPNRNGEAVTWTAVDPDLGALSTAHGVATDGTTWAVGDQAGNISTTTDVTAATWTAEGAVAGDVRNLVYGNGVWVASNTSGIIYTATDPTGSWTMRDTGIGALTGSALTYGDGVWVAGGGGGAIATATDPTSTWTDRTSTAGYPSEEISDVLFDGTNFIAVASSGAEIGFSSNPASAGAWTMNATDLSGFTSGINSIAYDGSGTYVAVGSGGKLATASTPGGTFTQRTSGFVTTSIFNVCFGGGGWVTSGANGKLATATFADPTSWTTRTSNLSSQSSELNCLLYGFGFWVVIANQSNASWAIPGA